MRILVAEDHRRLANAVAEGLRREGMAVDVAYDGADALAHVALLRYDVVVLDRDLPRVHGDDVCRQLIAEHGETRVLMLTAASTIRDRIEGLGLGADDYLTKPFSPRELLARIRTVLRRAKAATPTQAREGEVRAFRFGEFELNLRTRRLNGKGGERIDLTNGEFNLLAALLASAQRVMTRDQLIEASRVYDNEVYDRAIDVQILRLRRKIEADPSQPTHIVTERGVGYSFKAAVEKVY
jgi:two-component system, OmpR family, response regulator